MFLRFCFVRVFPFMYPFHLFFSSGTEKRRRRPHPVRSYLWAKMQSRNAGANGHTESSMGCVIIAAGNDPQHHDGGVNCFSMLNERICDYDAPRFGLGAGLLCVWMCVRRDVPPCWWAYKTYVEGFAAGVCLSPLPLSLVPEGRASCFCRQTTIVQAKQLRSWSSNHSTSTITMAMLDLHFCSLWCCGSMAHHLSVIKLTRPVRNLLALWAAYESFALKQLCVSEWECLYAEKFFRLRALLGREHLLALCELRSKRCGHLANTNYMRCIRTIFNIKLDDLQPIDAMYCN